MPEERHNTRCFRYIVSVMIMTGVWLPKRCQNRKDYKIMFILYSIAYQAVVRFPFYYMEMMHLTSVLGDLRAMTDNFTYFLSHLVIIPKVVMVHLKQKHLEKLFTKLNSSMFNRSGETKKRIIEDAVARSYRMAYIYGGAVVVAGVMWATIPLFSTNVYLPIQYPFVDNQSLRFILWYIYQTVVMFPLVLEAVAPDILAGMLMILSAAELDVLYIELQDIGTDNIKNSNDLDHADDKKPEIKEFQQRIQIDHAGNQFGFVDKCKSYEELILCVKFHQEIISFVDDINDVFNMPLLFQFAVSALIISCSCLRILLGATVVESASLLMYITWLLLQLLLFCYLGDALKEKSGLIAEAAYKCEWVSMSVRSRRTLLPIMIRAQTPLVITGGDMLTITLTTFAAVLRTSYSYLAVLRRSIADDTSRT